MNKVYARIERTRYGWWASYHTKNTESMIGMDYMEMSNFALTQRGIERKASRRIRRLQRDHDFVQNAYDFYGDNDE